MVNLPRASSSDPLIPLVFLGVPLTVVAAVALANRIVRNDEGAVRALFPPGGDVVAGRPAANPDQFGSLSPATRASTDPGRKPGVKAGAGEHGARRVSRSHPRKRGVRAHPWRLRVGATPPPGVGHVLRSEWENTPVPGHE